jgi:hypothetical protein
MCLLGFVVFFLKEEKFFILLLFQVDVQNFTLFVCIFDLEEFFFFGFLD